MFQVKQREKEHPWQTQHLKQDTAVQQKEKKKKLQNANK